MTKPHGAVLARYLDVLTRGTSHRRQGNGYGPWTPLRVEPGDCAAQSAWMRLLDLGMQAAAHLHERPYWCPELAGELQRELRDQWQAARLAVWDARQEGVG